MKFLTIILSVASLLAGNARAELVKELDVTASFFPGNHYSIGLDLDSSQLISRVYFQQPNIEPEFFTLDSLKSYATLFKVAGLSMVRMKIVKQDSPQSAVIDLQILQNYLSGSRRSILFQVKFNESHGQYEIIDTRNNHVVHSAQVITRYSFGVPIGLSDVVTE